MWAVHRRIDVIIKVCTSASPSSPGNPNYILEKYYKRGDV